MNKKQRNRKLVSQNIRNRMVNRRYSSTIKTLLKLFKIKQKNYLVSLEKTQGTLEEQSNILMLQELNKLANTIYSIIDKAVKKGVIHKNNAARKKSKIGKHLR
jgi:small subunit ribosomal protein S20